MAATSKAIRTAVGQWLASRAGRLAVALGLVFLLSGAAGLGFGSWRNLCVDCPSIAQIYVWEPIEATQLLADDGRLLDELFIERRTPVSLSQLPPHVAQAFIAVEDKRFYRHHGLDYIGITRAVVQNILQGGGAGGGSTITQQLTRNMFPEEIGFARRIRRKLKEAKVALELEEAYGKDQILEAYLNQVHFGHGWHGIETAARHYFGKSASEVDAAEAALLAAVVKAPTRYSPFLHPDRASARRNLILTLMAEQGYLAEEEVDRWKQHPLPEHRYADREVEAPYFVEWVRRILDERYGRELYTSGLRIHTTLNLDMQRIARRVMEEGYRRVESAPGYRHPKYDPAVRPPEGWPADETPYLQGLFVAVDPFTGEVKALIGGRDFEDSKFNRVTQARRQAGSTFKPIVYAAAIASGIPPSHVIVDAPVILEQVDGTEWRPQNYESDFLGPMTIREGLRHSRNMIAIKLGMEVGLETVAQYGRRLGIRTEVPPYPSTSIGAATVIPVEMAEAFTPFAARGIKVRPYPIQRVEDANGRVLWEARPERTQVLDSLVSAVMLSLLQDAANRGTGGRIREYLPWEIAAAGKTGTTNDATDVWFVGFTPDLLAAVWFGFDRPKTILPRAAGGLYAAPVWGQFMQAVYAGDAELGIEPLRPIPDPWPTPPELITREVDARSGKLKTDWCPRDLIYTEIYIPGTEPTEPCDLHGPSLIGLFRRVLDRIF
ncbi:MAG: PBP1A family penicillin-binding protein [Gemmatimonadetes bacterium]|nr:PBP1A family penicillin-binding protein [Gemmatimonadota bacterium]